MVRCAVWITRQTICLVHRAIPFGDFESASSYWREKKSWIQNNERHSATGKWTAAVSSLRKKREGKTQAEGGGSVKQKKERMHCLTLSVENRKLRKTAAASKGLENHAWRFLESQSQFTIQLSSVKKPKILTRVGRVGVFFYRVSGFFFLRTGACFLVFVSNVFHLSNNDAV